MGDTRGHKIYIFSSGGQRVDENRGNQQNIKAK